MFGFSSFVKKLETKLVESNVTYCYSRDALSPLKQGALYIVIPESIDREKNINKLKLFLEEYGYSWYIFETLDKDLPIIDMHLVYSYEIGMNILLAQIDINDSKEMLTVLEYANQTGITVYFTEKLNEKVRL